MITDLHAPLIPVLRYVLATTRLPQEGIMLDLACGEGDKLSLLAEHCGPDVQFIALDMDHGAVAATQQERTLAYGIVGDALALPLRDACCTAVFCIASLGLFANTQVALGEMHRVLQAGGGVFIVTATQLWAQVTHWPDTLVRAYEQALAADHSPPVATPDLHDQFGPLLRQAGFATPRARALLLNPSIPPVQAELALLSWNTIQPLVTPYLSPTDLELCHQVADSVEIELCTVVLVAVAII
ncbi:MAG: class I SAM-dependent methyltransferase [Chloroflexota bacterium]